MKRILVMFSLFILTSPIYAKGKSDVDLQEMKTIQEANSKILAETVQTLQQVRQELQELRGVVEESKHFIQEQNANSEKLLKDYDLRITGIEERLTLFGNQIQDVTTSGAKKGAAGNPEEEALYRRALAEVNTQNFKPAISLFDQFIKKFPKSTLLDNAQYWKGEAYFSLKDYPNAVNEFQKVVKNYPKSNKVPGAILKQGYSFFELKEYPDAKAFLEKVLNEFPTSSEAALAKEKIGKINQLTQHK